MQNVSAGGEIKDDMTFEESMEKRESSLEQQ